MISLLLLAVSAAPAQSAPVALPSKAAVFVPPAHEAALLKALEEESAPLLDVGATFPTPAVKNGGAELISAAKSAYDDLDYDGSIAKWNEALEYYIQHPAHADATIMGEVHFYIGTLAIQNGGKAQAKKGTEEFVRALRFNPALTCDPELYGPDVKAAFDKAHTELGALEKFELKINSTPEGATATHQGKSLGATPVGEAQSVAAGRHLVTFSKPGYTATATFVDASGNTEASATLEPVPDYAEVLDQARPLTDQVGKKGALPAGAKTLGEKLETRFLVLGDGDNVEVWDVDTGNRLAGLKLDDAESSAKQIAQFIANPAPLVAQTEASGDDDSILTKWWFWTAVGVVVVGGATTAGIVAAENGPKPFNILLGTP